MVALGSLTPRSLAVLAVVCLLSASLAGCMRSDLGSHPNDHDGGAPGASTGGDGGSRPATQGGPRGHPVTADLVAESAALDGIAGEERVSGEATFRLGTEIESLAKHRALVAYHARVDGHGEGVLFAFPAGDDVTLAGDFAYTRTRAALTPDELRYRVSSTGSSPFGTDVSESMRQRMEEMELGGTQFFSSEVRLRTSAPVTVEAGRLLLVTDDGAVELGTSARVVSAGPWSATTSVEHVLAPRALALDLAERRGSVLVANATGDLVLDDGERTFPLSRSYAAVTLGQPSQVKLTPTASGVEVGLSGYAFQVYEGGKARLPARLELSFQEASIDLNPNESRRVKLSIRNSDPDTDAVITGVDVSGAPDGHVRLPKFLLITETVFDAFKDEPLVLPFIALVSPALVLADVFVAIIEAIFGPPKVPQVIEAGTTFTTEATVTGADRAFEATVTFEGNFDAASARIAVK